MNLNKESDIIRFLTYYKIPYISYSTMISKYVESDGKRYFISDLRLKNKELGFISTVKRDAKFFSELHEGKHVDRQSIRYAHLDNIPTGVYKNMIEVDISAAYWSTAYKLGIISQSTYEKGLSLSKQAKLVALGSLASNKAAFIFNGRELKYVGTNKKIEILNFDNFSYIDKKKKEIDLSHLFFWISNEISFVVQEIYSRLNSIKKDGCLGYWVDAVFVDKDLIFEAIKIMEKYGYGFKVKPIHSVICSVKDGSKTIYMVEEKRKEPCSLSETDIRIKPFFVDSFNKKERKEKEGIDLVSDAMRVLSKIK